MSHPKPYIPDPNSSADCQGNIRINPISPSNLSSNCSSMKAVFLAMGGVRFEELRVPILLSERQPKGLAQVGWIRGDEGCPI